MKQMIHRGEKGFTMAELLVVIAIMAILVGVAVGSFTGLISSGEGQSSTYEKEAVQTAVDAWISTHTSETLEARLSPAVISASPTSDAPFITMIRRLPTTYMYTWTASGTGTAAEVTQHGKG